MQIVQSSYDNVAVQMKAAAANYLKRKQAELDLMRKIGSDDDSDQQYEEQLSNLEPTYAGEN